MERTRCAVADRFSFETEKNETRVAVARNKPCEGCGRSWDECGGGYIGFAEGAGLEAKWKCEACMPPVFACGRPSCHCRAQVHLSDAEMLAYMTTGSLPDIPSRASIVVDKLTEPSTATTPDPREIAASLGAMLRRASTAPGECVIIESTLIDGDPERPVLYIRRGGRCEIAATPEAALLAVAVILAEGAVGR